MSTTAEQSRKVLEEVQKAKSLLKQGAGVGVVPVLPTQFIPATNNATSLMGNYTETHMMSPLQRTAVQSLQLANSTSFGSFIATDSHFGNGILPVLPRLNSPDTSNTNKSTTEVSLLKSNVKTEIL